MTPQNAPRPSQMAVTGVFLARRRGMANAADALPFHPATAAAQDAAGLAPGSVLPLEADEFVEAVRQAIPPGTGVVLRGSAVTGSRWKDGAPFDADGPGTSDLDLTLVGGDEVIGLYKVTGFWVPGFNSRPLSDEDPDIAPDLVPLRERLMAMVNRPVNIQGARDVVMYLRGELVGQPYLVLIDKPADEDA